MKKNIYLTVITIVTVICILFGTGTFLGGWESGFVMHNESGKETDRSSFETAEIEKYTNLVIEGEVMDIHMNRGDGYSIEYKCTKGLEPNYQVKDGTLTITQEKKHYNLFGINNGCEMYLTIPKGVTLSSVDIESDVGDISMNDMSWEKCDVSTNVGDIYMYGADLGDACFCSDTGDITLEECDFQDMDVESDVGDVEISTRKDCSSYRLDFITDVGEIRVNGRTCERTFYQQGNGKNYVEIQGDVGNISFVYE